MFSRENLIPVIEEIAQQMITFVTIYAAGDMEFSTCVACLLLLVLSGRFGFYKYMKMDEEEDDRPFFFPNPDGIY